MTTTAPAPTYTALTLEQRQAALVQALEAMKASATWYADLNAAEAALALRRHLPGAVIARFDLDAQGDGTYSASLISVRDRAGRLLWLVDDLDESDAVEDDTEVTDRLATAQVCHRGYFGPADEPGRTGRTRTVYELHLPTALAISP